MPPTAPLGFYWGDDAYSVARGPDALAARLAGDGPPLDRLRLSGSATTTDEIAEKVATATLFGGGTLVVIAEPAPLISTRPLAARMVATLAAVASGNGLAFLDLVDGTAKRPASLEHLRKAVEAAGGEVREFKAPTPDGMARWIADRARERDINRSRQGELAVAELEKLALYRLDGQIGPEDVKVLVAAAVPGSAWAFLDAVGMRRADVAADLAEKLDDVAGPLLLVQLHRRIKELIDIADLLAIGTSAGALVRTLKLNPYRAEKLAEQARTWTLPELDAAMAGLLEMDAALKSASRRRAAICLWIAEKVRRTSQR